MDIQDRGGRSLSQRRTRAHAKGRANGDGSFYQTKDGLWRGVAYVRTPTGEIKRKYVSSKDRDQAHRVGRPGQQGQLRPAGRRQFPTA